ncbi:myosin light chain kinase, smooth muscle-like [Hoplias malabaricus]|uniref:myosin light chain kinase, smooth muscle-like n=1 Tax=Hoplias malabaricus TaxID=27720 RepID=UPI003462045B
MGSTPSKPEFVTVLADKTVKTGQYIKLSCEANTSEVTVNWKKAGNKLQCVEGKHKVGNNDNFFFLEINNAEPEDEGNYTLNLSNDLGSVSCSSMVFVELKEWRKVAKKQEPLISTLKSFTISSEEVREIRILLHGPIGAGKSSIINTLKSIFEGHQFINCLTANADSGGKSFTTKYQKFSIGTLPFAFYDVMGLEEDENCKEIHKNKGVHTEDIINALKGHIPDDYEFSPTDPMIKEDEGYIRNPSINNKIHCLVSVIPADKISLISEDIIKKMSNIRAEASKLGIPQLLVMTRVDKVCELTREDLGKVYQSKKIKEKIQMGSNRVGVTENCIFPVKNYHEEISSNEQLNCLALQAFTQIVYSANDYIKRWSTSQKQALSVPLESRMGKSPSKPEFVTVLANKTVKTGQNVVLRCEANTSDVSKRWEKAGHTLQCVEGKHRVVHNGTTFCLEIKDVKQEDEGNYTLNLENSSGTASCSAMVLVEIGEWRKLDKKQEPLITHLMNFEMCSKEIRELRILLHGPIGAGKSSIINTLKSIFEGHQFINCLAANSDGGAKSFTKKYEKFPIKTLPVAFFDVMGLEPGQSKGVNTDDIIKALKGHIPENYEFKEKIPMIEEHRDYISNPGINNKIHCLVSVVAADRISLMADEVFQKMKQIRAEASVLGIPQLVFITKVDMVCALTQEDLGKIYQSKKIKEKIRECSNRLGVTENCIFPVKNYHNEIRSNEQLNCLALQAFTQVVYSADDYVKRWSSTRKQVE